MHILQKGTGEVKGKAGKSKDRRVAQGKSFVFVQNNGRNRARTVVRYNLVFFENGETP